VALAVGSMLQILLGRPLTLGMVRTINTGSSRRDMQCFVLGVPLLGLWLGFVGLHHFLGRTCFSRAPSWDVLVGAALPLGMGLIASGALLLGVGRLVLLACVVTRGSLPAGPRLQGLTDDLAHRLGAARTRVLLRASDRPLAFAFGLWQPTVLLSTWMVEHLDSRELEAVLAHELEHVARHDSLVVWLATILRDAFFYLPPCRAAYLQLQREKELACDDLAVSATHRPLAMASALAKVWLHATEGPRAARFGKVQSMVGDGELIDGRLERLLAQPRPAGGLPCSHRGAIRAGLPMLVGLLLLEAVTVVLILASMGCGPALWLEKLV